jgi:hypothetical protein
MRMLTRRLQILLDERQYARLAAYARERNLSVGAAVRVVIDAAIPAARDERRAAARRVLTADAMSVPPPAELRRELEDLRARRA